MQPYYLGRCAYSAHNFSRFEPLLVATDDGWKSVVDREYGFPDEGKVFSVLPETLRIPEGSFWTFKIEANPRYDPQKKGDRFVVAKVPVPSLATDVIDLSSIPMEQARRKVVEEGLRLAWSPLGDCIILLENGDYVRVRLERDEHRGGLWVPAATPLERLELFHASKPVSGDAVSERRKFLIPGREAGEPIGRIDWSPDREFFPRAVARLRRQALKQGGNDWVHLTKDAVERLAGALSESRLWPHDRAEWEVMAKRIRAFLPDFAANVADLDAIVETLEGMKPIEERIGLDVEKRRAELEGELRGQLEKNLQEQFERENAELVGRLDGIRSEINLALDRRDALLAETAEIERKRQQLADVLADEVSEIHDVFQLAPKAAGASVRRMADRLAVVVSGTSGTNVCPPELPPWAADLGGEAGPVSLEELGPRLDDVADRWGVSSLRLGELDVLARAGELVVLQGSGGRALLEAYCHAVAGGRLRRAVLDPTVISVDDVWRQPGIGSATAFAHAWTAACNRPDRAVLFVFDRMQASPLDLWLPALGSALRLRSRPRNLLLAGIVDGPPMAPQRSTMDAFAGLLIPPPDDGPDAAIRAVLRAFALEDAGPPTVLTGIDGPLKVDEWAKDSALKLASNTPRDALSAERGAMILRAARTTMPDQGPTLAAEALDAFRDVGGTRFEAGRAALAKMISNGSLTNGTNNA